MWVRLNSYRIGINFHENGEYVLKVRRNKFARLILGIEKGRWVQLTNVCFIILFLLYKSMLRLSLN